MLVTLLKWMPIATEPKNEIINIQDVDGRKIVQGAVYECMPIYVLPVRNYIRTQS